MAKQIRSDARALKRGILRHKVEEVPEYMTGGVKDIVNVSLEVRNGRGNWEFYKNVGNVIKSIEDKTKEE